MFYINLRYYYNNVIYSNIYILLSIYLHAFYNYYSAAVSVKIILRSDAYATLPKKVSLPFWTEKLVTNKIIIPKKSFFSGMENFKWE